MGFIKAQKIVRDENGNIVSGSASIVDTIYGNYGTYHSKQQVRERLGKVIYLSRDKKTGIFLSPTRGMVQYEADSDTFSPVMSDDARIPGTPGSSVPEIHTVFGDSYLFLEFLQKSGLNSILKSVFDKKTDYERAICHFAHGVLRDGARISCENFIEKSFLSYLAGDVVNSSLLSDTRFFSMLGNDSVKLSFFRAFISQMRLTSPGFGKGCYVDSTPLPNDMMDNPFNALCCHGVSSSEVMMRLMLVIDDESGLPVWYDILPGNILDISTVQTAVEDVKASLDIDISSFVLDAGYISKELIEKIHIGTDRTIIGRMPARKGYPYKELYWKLYHQMKEAKYTFVRNRHTYFGKKVEQELFGQKMFCYVYVDQWNALSRFRDYLIEHPREYGAMKDKDKEWLSVKYGYFILVSNIDTDPCDLLSRYFGRTEIECVFKTGKEYLDLLPISKWTDLTVRGKILQDIIDTIILLKFRAAVSGSGTSTSEIFGKTQSLMCFLNSNSEVIVETPNKKVKEYYKLLKTEIPTHINLKRYATQLFG